MRGLMYISVDLIVTGFIIFAVVGGWEWARWVVLIYTGLMLLLRLGAQLGGRALGRMQPAPEGPPSWVFHLLYLIDVSVLAAGGWWIAASGWLVIWVLSYLQEKR